MNRSSDLLSIYSHVDIISKIIYVEALKQLQLVTKKTIFITHYTNLGMILWQKNRIRSDVDTFIRHYSKKTGTSPKGVRIEPFKHLWGSCGKNGIINLNWQLIFAPKSVLEYAIVHEICHLQYRNHSSKFWSKVKGVLPDYELRKNWLDRNEHSLETDKLGIEGEIVRE